MSEPKKIIIIAGPNGAGKTTFAREFLPLEASCPSFINADLIAQGISPFAPETVAIAAGRIMLNLINEQVEKGSSFAFETTLSGRGYARMIPQWRGLGYRVELVFLTLPSIEFAVERVAQRVRQGGHDIPRAVIARRFVSGLRQFDGVYQSLVDAWTLIDTSTSPYEVLDWSERQ
ncbi:MAG: Zeta toxin family protein [Betaproteobacteria bacterium]|nr:MAG: Zeta toxin family protein [Betaproteobacteria bacterium]